MTYEEIIGFGLSVIGLRRDDLDSLSIAEFNETVKAYSKQRESDIKHRYEVARFEAWLCLSPHMKKGLSQEDIFRFPWEEMKKGKLLEWQEIPTIKN